MGRSVAPLQMLWTVPLTPNLHNVPSTVIHARKGIDINSRDFCAIQKPNPGEASPLSSSLEKAQESVKGDGCNNNLVWVESAPKQRS